MQDVVRISHVQALAGSLDALIVFAEQEDDFLLAAKLDEVRVRFADRYTSASQVPAPSVIAMPQR